MPPFGKRWFRVLREIGNGHPIAELRAHWMMLNIAEDERLEAERRKDEIEYGGFFAGPEVYAQLKGLSKKGGVFEVVRDTSEYDRRLEAATRGDVKLRGRRSDVAAMVRRKRAEQIASWQEPLDIDGRDDDDGDDDDVSARPQVVGPSAKPGWTPVDAINVDMFDDGPDDDDDDDNDGLIVEE